VDLNLFRAHLEQGRLVAPFDTTLDDGFGYYLVTDSEALGDPAIALFRSWLIERFAPRPPTHPWSSSGMTDLENPRRPDARDAAAVPPPRAPRLLQRAPPLTVTSRIPSSRCGCFPDDEVGALHEAALLILETHGMKVLSADARRRYRDGGSEGR